MVTTTTTTTTALATPDEVCNYKPAAKCRPVFEYKGQKYIGCTTSIRWPIFVWLTTWCSHDGIYAGAWSKCSWACEPSAAEVVRVNKMAEEQRAEERSANEARRNHHHLVHNRPVHAEPSRPTRQRLAPDGSDDDDRE